MELSDRFLQVKNTAKHEKHFPSYTQDDVVFLLRDVTRPVGLIMLYNVKLTQRQIFSIMVRMLDWKSSIFIVIYFQTSSHPVFEK